MTIKEQIKRFAELKQAMTEVKTKLKEVEADLYQKMMALGEGFETLGDKEVGKITIVYSKNYIFTPKANKTLVPLLDEVQNAKELLSVKSDIVKDKEKSLILAGEAKEDKQFSYIKYTKPNK